MKKLDGLKISLIDETKLASSGILVGGCNNPKGTGLSQPAVDLFLLVASAGPSGLAKSKVPAQFKEQFAEIVLELELQNLVAWELDARGNKTYLVLTWRGFDALDAARGPRPKTSIAQQRRASIKVR